MVHGLITSCPQKDNKGKFIKGMIPWNKGLIFTVPKKRYVPRICENCGKTYIFIGSSQKYCEECKHITVKCYVCNKYFKKRRSLYDYIKKHNPNRVLFCSKKCRGKSQRTIPTLYCKECRKKINNIEGHRNRKFCCRACYDKWQNNKEKRECVWCEKPFLVTENAKQKYCCKRCALSSTGETDIEKIMREELERRNIPFEQYTKVGRFFVDFLLKDKIIIECDGIHWHTKPEVIERDKRKNEYLESNGYTLFRFTDKQIKNNIQECIKMIK